MSERKTGGALQMCASRFSFVLPLAVQFVYDEEIEFDNV